MSASQHTVFSKDYLWTLYHRYKGYYIFIYPVYSFFFSSKLKYIYFQIFFQIFYSCKTYKNAYTYGILNVDAEQHIHKYLYNFWVKRHLKIPECNTLSEKKKKNRNGSIFFLLNYFALKLVLSYQKWYWKLCSIWKSKPEFSWSLKTSNLNKLQQLKFMTMLYSLVHCIFQ